jgi:hypothetical protein
MVNRFVKDTTGAELNLAPHNDEDVIMYLRRHWVTELKARV